MYIFWLKIFILIFKYFLIINVWTNSNSDINYLQDLLDFTSMTLSKFHYEHSDNVQQEQKIELKN